jgi:hypothetical protein
MRQGCELHGNQYGSAYHFGFHSRALATARRLLRMLRMLIFTAEGPRSIDDDELRQIIRLERG